MIGKPIFCTDSILFTITKINDTHHFLLLDLFPDLFNLLKNNRHGTVIKKINLFNNELMKSFEVMTN